MDRRGFVTSGMAAGLAGLSGTGVALNALLERTPGWGLGKTLPSGDIRLSSNENPLGLAPAAREAVVGAIVDANRYPGNYRGPLMEGRTSRSASDRPRSSRSRCRRCRAPTRR
jgi:hypothetical protein